jgi:predicted ATP-dependent serine protease
VGKCPVCSEWNTYAEEIVDKTEEKLKEKEVVDIGYKNKWS